MPVVGAERNRVVAASGVASSVFFVQQHAQQGHHVRIAIQMRRFFEGPVRFLGDVAQMGKVDAVRNARRNGRNVVTRIGAQRAGAQRDTVGRIVLLR